MILLGTNCVSREYAVSGGGASLEMIWLTKTQQPLLQGLADKDSSRHDDHVGEAIRRYTSIPMYEYSLFGSAFDHS